MTVAHIKFYKLYQKKDKDEVFGEKYFKHAPCLYIVDCNEHITAHYISKVDKKKETMTVNAMTIDELPDGVKEVSRGEFVSMVQPDAGQWSVIMN